MDIFAETIYEVLQRQLIAHSTCIQALEVREESTNFVIHCIWNVSFDEPTEIDAIHPLVNLVHAKLVKNGLKLHLAGHNDVSDLVLQE